MTRILLLLALLVGACEEKVSTSAPEPTRASRPPAAANGAPARPLFPVGAFLTGDRIPPGGVGAYGIVAFPAKATETSRARHEHVCRAFTATLPSQESVAGAVRLEDQMVTVWPLERPLASPGDCAAAVRDYALFAGQAAIRDAQLQGAALAGRGPFLIGWSPARTRGQPDALVLVIDLSSLTSEANLAEAFQVWRERIIDDPSTWRDGFSLELIRLRIRDFLDRHGAAILQVVKA